MRPRAARSSKVMTQSSRRVERSTAAVSTRTTFSTPGIASRCSTSLASWLPSSAKTMREPESLRMKRDVLAVGRGVDRRGRAAGAASRRGRRRSTRGGCAIAIATRSSGSRPSESRPAASSVTRSPLRPQLHDSQPPLEVGARNASRAGSDATRARNSAAERGGRLGQRLGAASWCAPRSGRTALRRSGSRTRTLLAAFSGCPGRPGFAGAYAAGPPARCVPHSAAPTGARGQTIPGSATAFEPRRTPGAPTWAWRGCRRSRARR